MRSEAKEEKHMPAAGGEGVPHLGERKCPHDMSEVVLTWPEWYNQMSERCILSAGSNLSGIINKFLLVC